MDPNTLGAIWALINSMSGTPYTHSFGPGGTDCSGLASAVANVATGRPAFVSRMNTRTEEGWLLSHGFVYGSAPNSLVIGWNGGHTAVTLPDGTSVSSGERGGVRVGGGGAWEPQFGMHMYLPSSQLVSAHKEYVPAQQENVPDDPPPATPPEITDPNIPSS